MSDFRSFAAQIAAQFKQMATHPLYRTDATGDELWALYLASFPEGTNPIYRVRTEHDGSYDRSFVRKMGNVVSIAADGELRSIWDAPGLAYPYNIVAKALSERVKAAAVCDLFLSKEALVGCPRSIERLDDGSTHAWYHFHADIPAHLRSARVDEALGQARTTVQVMRRGFEELKPQVLADVLDLIAANALYRGAEFATAIREFQAVQRKYLTFARPDLANNFLWLNRQSPVARLRNTAIGTLLIELSEGMELELAVTRYERMVAPTNYKRPTALATPAMIDKAIATVRELDLEAALDRRFAKLSDLSIHNVLWADGFSTLSMKGGAAGALDALREDVAATVSPDKLVAGHPISLDTFLATVLPKASKLELYLASNKQKNLVSLTAPVHANAGSLFKWDNNFAWSYKGNVTDSIKERVKAAGGNVNAKLRVSLAWTNTDDLDLHAHCPDGHVFYATKGGDHRLGNGQILDVDMNVAHVVRNPVENLAWTQPRDGLYRIAVNQFRQRETSDVGFTLQVECDGQVTHFHYPRAVKGTVEAISFRIRNGQLTDLTRTSDGLTEHAPSQSVWSLNTQSFVRVSTVLNSPNHWDGQATGNKHWFFMLPGCQNDEPARGIYNEFLKPELEVHRKVFELLGNKTKCPVVPDQLSGVGFSSTQPDTVILRAMVNNTVRVYNVTI